MTKFFNKRPLDYKSIGRSFIIFFIPIFIILATLLVITYIWQLGTGVILVITFLITTLVTFLASLFNYYRNKETEKLQIADVIFDNSSEAILVTNEETEIIYVNESFTKITGYGKEEVLGKKTSYFKSGRHSKEFYTSMWKRLGKNKKWQGEIWDKRKNGQIYPKFLTIRKVELDDNIIYIGIFEDITQQKATENHINLLKNYDDVTGLPNYVLFEKILKKTVENNEDKLLAVISIIISNYNNVYDSFGYKGSNEILVKFINKIKNEVLENGVLARVSKDEFLLLVNYVKDEKDILAYSDKIISIFNEGLNLQGENVFFNGYLGISVYPEDSNSPKEIIEFSNIARSYAQRENISNYKFYKKGLKEEYLDYIKLESLLRHALDKDEFVLQFQPQIDIKNNLICGGEALIRWNSKELGRVPPDRFISIAEKTDLIIPIGEWVLRESIREAKKWIILGYENILVSVNISPIQFKKSNIALTINNILKEENFNPRNLEVEITEGIVINNTKEVIKTLEELKLIGVKIAVDDFGTGYSSLGYLRDLPVNKLKIDRQFIKDYPERDDGTIAEIIVNLSHGLGLKVIAEGVETKEQLSFIKSIKCDEVQGYYYSMPLDSQDFIGFLLEGDLHNVRNYS